MPGTPYVETDRVARCRRALLQLLLSPRWPELYRLVSPHLLVSSTPPPPRTHDPWHLAVTYFSRWCVSLWVMSTTIPCPLPPMYCLSMVGKCRHTRTIHLSHQPSWNICSSVCFKANRVACSGPKRFTYKRCQAQFWKTCDTTKPPFAL